MKTAPSSTQRTLSALLAAFLLLPLMPGHSADITAVISAATNGNTWSNTASWDPSTAAPGLADTVFFDDPIPWPTSWTLNLDAGWAAGTLNLITDTTQHNAHNLTLQAPGTIGVFNVDFNHNLGGAGFRLQQGSHQLTLREFNNIGTVYGTWSWGDNVAVEFVDAAQITYYQGQQTSFSTTVDFSSADSVHLVRSTALGTTISERIGNRNQNGGGIIVGRTDNATQNWTVGANSNPVLHATVNNQGTTFQKRGSGAVNMGGVDLLVTSPLNTGISSNGREQGNTSGGTITANSLTVDMTGATASRIYGILEHVVLDGQSGLDAGGTGTGRAVTITAGNQDILVSMINSGSSISGLGHLEVASTGGDLVLTSTGTGAIGLRFNNRSRDDKTRTNDAVVTANTFVLDVPDSYLTDRNTWSEANSPATANNDAGGKMEFRGSFIAASTENTLWRTDAATTAFYAIGDNAFSSTFEVMSLDLGTSGPGASNFLLNSLVVGRDASGADFTSSLRLVDTFSNSAGIDPEAMYVNSLLMFNGSSIDIQNGNFYYNDGINWVQASEGAYTLNGSDGYFVIPEPSAHALLLGVAALWLLGRSRRLRARPSAA